MTNNEVLRQIRLSLDLDNSTLIEIFKMADHKITDEQLANWLMPEDNAGYEECSGTMLATFLNGLINHKRGKKEGKQPVPETQLTNNIVFTKLRIALNLKSDDILEILELASCNLTKNELGAFFRKPKNTHYRICSDEILFKFLTGVQLKYLESNE